MLDPELIDTVLERLTSNFRWKYIFRHESDDSNNYIPGMYIPSERDPDEATKYHPAVDKINQGDQRGHTLQSPLR